MPLAYRTTHTPLRVRGVTGSTVQVNRGHAHRRDRTRPAGSALRAPNPSWTVFAAVGGSGGIVKNGPCTV
eukprot:1754353-Prymnesium_polylepis.1